MRLTPGLVWRLTTSPLRPLPDFLIIGAARAGTTSLYEYLQASPGFAPARRKETHFFDTLYNWGPLVYRHFFPLSARRSGIKTADGTPAPLYYPELPPRIVDMLPEALFIALLRDPVERAYSHHQLNYRRGYETLGFEDALAAEESRLASGESLSVRQHCYFNRGLYAEQLQRWYRHVEPSRIMVLPSERLFTEPHKTVEAVCDWLGIPDPIGLNPTIYNAVPAAPMQSATRQRLAELYAPYNAALFELLGEKFAWTEP